MVESRAPPPTLKYGLLGVALGVFYSRERREQVYNAEWDCMRNEMDEIFYVVLYPYIRSNTSIIINCSSNIRHTCIRDQAIQWSYLCVRDHLCEF